MIGRLVVVAAVALPAIASANPFPFGDPWSRDVYAQTSPWASAEVSAGVALMPLDPLISTKSTGAGSTFGLRGLLHLNHLLSFPVEMEFRSFRASPGMLQEGWKSYETSSFMLGTGVRITPLASEYFEVAVSGRLGMSAGSEEGILSEDAYAWGGTVAYFGGGAELAFFPMQSLMVGLAYNFEVLTEGPDHKGYSNWEVDVPPQGGRNGSSISLRAGWNF